MFGKPLPEWLAATYPPEPGASLCDSRAYWRSHILNYFQSVGCPLQDWHLGDRPITSARSLLDWIDGIRVGQDPQHRERLRWRPALNTLMEADVPVSRSQEELLRTALDLLRGDDRYVLIRGHSDSRYAGPNASVARLLAPEWVALTRALGDCVALRLITDFVLLERVGPSCYIQLSGRVGLERLSAKSAKAPQTHREIPCDMRGASHRLHINADPHRTECPTKARIETSKAHALPISTKSIALGPYGITTRNPYLAMHPSKSNAKRLLALAAAGLCSREEYHGGACLPLRCSSCIRFLDAFRCILVRAWDIPLKGMLNHYCPSKATTVDQSQPVMKKYASSRRSVFHFLFAIFRSIVPTCVFESFTFEIWVRKAISSFLLSKISSTPYDVRLHVAQLMETVQFQQHQPMSFGDAGVCRNHPLHIQHIFSFLFNAIVIHVFDECFVLSAADRAEMRRLILRRDSLFVFRTQAIAHLVRSGDFERMRKNLGKRTGHWTSVRILPKANSFRLVQKMSPDTQGKETTLIHAVCLYERLSRPEAFGASIRSLTEMHQRWAAFVQRWRRFGRPPLFALCFDIRQAFDSIPLKRFLWRELSDFFHSEAYALRRFIVTDKQFRFPQRKWFACPIADVTRGYDAFALQYLQSARSKIIADEGVICSLHTADIISHLRRIIGSNQVHFGDHSSALIQRRGIPQGLPISSILCDFHLGCFERKCLKDFLRVNSTKDPPSLLMRYVDDVFFVTSEVSIFRAFCNRVQQCSKALGVMPSPGKTRKCVAGGRKPRIEWCGMIFDLQSAQVLLRMPRSIPSEAPDAAVFFSKCKTASHPRILRRFISIFASQMQSVFLDLSINGPETVKRNICTALRLALNRIGENDLRSSLREKPAQRILLRWLRQTTMNRCCRWEPLSEQTPQTYRSELNRILCEGFRIILHKCIHNEDCFQGCRAASSCA